LTILRTTARPSPRRKAGPANRRVTRTVATLALALLIAACAGGQGDETGPEAPSGPEVEDPAASEDPTGDDGGEAGGEGVPGEDGEGSEGEDEAAGDETAAGPAVDPASVEADELGVVPVMMYHQIREDGGSEWDMTPEEFRDELVRLFDLGFVPIRTVDLVRGEIDIPAGRSPVVLTFDDSPRSQARFDDGGGWAPETAMGILTEVAAQYDEVEPIASFYLITSSMFGAVADSPDIVQALHDDGIELGNHTHNHANLRAIGPDEVQEELARAVVEITDIVPDAEVVTLSLPFGIAPEDRDLLAEGTGESGSYTNEGVLLVGDRPAPSPFHADFQPLAIPRIKTLADPEDEFGSAWWIGVMETSDSWRPYVSDGDPNTISFPADREEELHEDLADRANPY
jgi:hypothetical protein